MAHPCQRTAIKRLMVLGACRGQDTEEQAEIIARLMEAGYWENVFAKRVGQHWSRHWESVVGSLAWFRPCLELGWERTASGGSLSPI